MNANFEFRIVVIEDFNTVDFNFAGWHFEVLAFAGEFVGAFAVYFYCAEFGRSLPYFANE